MRLDFSRCLLNYKLAHAELSWADWFDVSLGSAMARWPSRTCYKKQDFVVRRNRAFFYSSAPLATFSGEASTAQKQPTSIDRWQLRITNVHLHRFFLVLPSTFPPHVAAFYHQLLRNNLKSNQERKERIYTRKNFMNNRSSASRKQSVSNSVGSWKKSSRFGRLSTRSYTVFVNCNIPINLIISYLPHTTFLS